jgi:hypothetical protein
MKYAPLMCQYKKCGMTQFWIFWKLLFLKFHVFHVCAIDTVIPSWFVSRLKGKKVVFDIFDIHSEAHFGNSKNLFCKTLKFVENFFINHVDAVIIVDDSRCTKSTVRILEDLK